MTSERAGRAARAGAPVSLQAVMIGFAVGGGLLAAVASWSADGVTGPAFVVTVVLGVAAVAAAVVGWLRARAAGALSPFAVWTERDARLDRLTVEQRRDLNRQLTGRRPVTPGTAELVRVVIRRQRRRAAAVVPSLVAVFLVVAALAVGSGVVGWGAVGLVVMLVVLLVVTRYETRRDDRALARADEVAPPE